MDMNQYRLNEILPAREPWSFRMTGGTWSRIETTGEMSPADVVMFKTREEMDAQALNVVRTHERDMQLWEKTEKGWELLAAVAFDGEEPEPNEDVKLRYRAVIDLQMTVRLYDHDGKLRDPVESARWNLDDVLGNEMTYEEPEETDFVQEIDGFEITEFGLVAPVEPADL